MVPSVVDLGLQQAERLGDRRLYTALRNGETEDGALSFAELALAAQRLGAHLQERGRPGDRVLLLFPPGLDYLVGFFGTLFAGQVPVPLYPPDPTALQRSLPRLDAVARDARPDRVLVNAMVMGFAKMMLPQLPALAGVEWLDVGQVDRDAAGRWRAPGGRA